MKAKIIIALILTVFLFGCVGGVSTGKIEEPTAGQELIDLKKALEQGAINEEEYVDLKRKIMNKSE